MTFLRTLFAIRRSTPQTPRRKPRFDVLEDRTVPYAGAGLQFNITTGTGASQPTAQMIAGFQQAAAIWSSYLSDDILVNVRLDQSSSIPLGGFGNTAPASKIKSLTEIRNALAADQTSLSDVTAVAHLPQGSSAAVYTTNFATGAPLFDNNGTDNNSSFSVNRANLKAMGLLAANDPGLDGVIQFTTQNVWDYDPSNGISPGKWDFVGSAVHELGHLMGFMSGAATVDIRSMPKGPGYNAGIVEDNYIVNMPLDLFRQSAGSVAAGANFDIRADKADKFFSIDGGATQIAGFATGIYNGDGDQCGHWKDNLGLGVMDPGSDFGGEVFSISKNDIQALDVIGWNVTPPHAPVVGNATTLEGTLSSPIPISAAAGDSVVAFKISNISGGTLYQADGTTPIASGTFLTPAQAQAGVRFLPPYNGAGVGSFDVECSANGVNVSGPKSTSTITVKAISALQIGGILGGSTLSMSVAINNGVYTGSGKLVAPTNAYYNLTVQSGTRQGSTVHLHGSISPPGSSAQIAFDLDVDLATGFLTFSYKGANGLPVVMTANGTVVKS